MSSSHHFYGVSAQTPLTSSGPAPGYLGVPFVDLTESHDRQRRLFHEALDAVLNTDSLILGRHLEEFERQFSMIAGTSLSAGVSNGADALELIFRALSLQPDDEVIVPANSFFASASAITMAGAKAVFCDVGDDALINVHTVESVKTERTRAVLAVHLYGQCVDINPLYEWANIRDITIVEDAAQAHGASYHGRPAGSLGLAAAFSFYPTKNLGALGDAGAVTSNDFDLMERIYALRNYGSKTKNEHNIMGRNCRMDSLQAASLSIKAEKLTQDVARRRNVARKYNEGLAGLPLTPIACKNPSEHAFHLYVVELNDPSERENFCAHLAQHGVQTSIHYPTPIHRQAAYAANKAESLPMAERLAKSIVSLPMFPAINAQQIEHVIACVRSFWD